MFIIRESLPLRESLRRHISNICSKYAVLRTQVYIFVIFKVIIFQRNKTSVFLYAVKGRFSAS